VSWVGVRRLTVQACWIAVIAPFLGACSPPAGPIDPKTRNLLLVTIDTLRADHLGVYGYQRPTSPQLDRFAEDAVVFDAAYSSSSWTLPGIATLMTGLYTSTHGCWNGRSYLAPLFPTLAEQLAAGGLDTAAVVSHVFLDPRYGLDQGFGLYDDELVRETKRASHLAITSPQITDKAVRWLEARAGTNGRPWFLWVHFFDPHLRYLAHEGVSEAFGSSDPEDLYDGEIAFTDLHLGRLLDRLDELGMRDSTLVIVTSDHGEEFGDHGGIGHRSTLYREVQRIPLVIRAPGVEPGRREEVVSLVDVSPTVLELLGGAALEPVAGRSLAPLLRGDALGVRPVLGELGGNQLWSRSIITGRWKLLIDYKKKLQQLFDLSNDSAERRDLAEHEPERVEELRDLLQTEIARALKWQKAYGSAGELDLSPADLEHLRDLGYVEN
jgi:arylsulfatase A-like enzyme